MLTENGTYTLFLLGWLSVNPMTDKYPSLSGYNYCANNPVMLVDRDGRATEPVYDLEGNHLGNTKEGFTGRIIIYSGDRKNFSSMTAEDLLNIGSNSEETVSTYDNASVDGALSDDAKSKILTNIIAHFEGLQVYDEKFTMNDIEGGKIHIGTGLDSQNQHYNFLSTYALKAGKGKIETRSHISSFEITVENVAATIIVHEWYSHIKKNQGSYYKTHRLAYRNVERYKKSWDRTTAKYKAFNTKLRKEYEKSETGRNY